MSKVIRLCLVALFLIPTGIAPFVAIRPIQSFYQENHRRVKEYECYPVEECNFDFNGDSKAEVFQVEDRPSGDEYHNFRLVITTNDGMTRKEILNIKYDQTDGTFRTHVAAFEENGRKKLVIYDTINTHQFFFWDGNRLSPSENMSFLERKIRSAMELEDDTGRAQKSAVYFTIALFILFYYGVIVVGIVGYFYLRNKYTGVFL